MLKNSDVLLGLDDPDLYNPKTAKNLLLSSYSRQIALVGPNAAFFMPVAWPARTAINPIGWPSSTNCSTASQPLGRERSIPNVLKFQVMRRSLVPWVSSQSMKRLLPASWLKRKPSMNLRRRWDINTRTQLISWALHCCSAVADQFLYLRADPGFRARSSITGQLIANQLARPPSTG